MVWMGCICCENMSLGSNGVDRVCSLGRIATRLRCKNFALIAPVRPILHQVLCSNETVPDARKQNETHQNMSLWSNGVDRVDSLRKITTQVRGTKYCINCTSFGRFAPSSVQ